MKTTTRILLWWHNICPKHLTIKYTTYFNPSYCEECVREKRSRKAAKKAALVERVKLEAS